MSLHVKLRLQNLCGFSFPEDFFQFHEWTMQHPQINFQEDLEIELLPTYYIFKEGFNINNLFDFVHTFRYYDDPPEFVGLFRGFTDGLHWGYYFDSPDELSPVVVNYYHSDSYELEVDGDTTFAAVRKVLEERFAVDTEYFHEDEEYYGNRMNTHNTIRPLLLQFTHGRTETGEKYTNTHSGNDKRNNLIIAPTYHQLGIVAGKEMYRDIGEIPYQLEDEQIERFIALAYQSLQEGYPATSLQVAHNFWVGKRSFREPTNDLFKKSYEALGRQKLIPLLEVAIASRQAFDQENEAREKSILERVARFHAGMKIRFRRQKGEVLKIEGNVPALTALIKWEDEHESQSFRLDRYAFHFRIPSDYDFIEE